MKTQIITLILLLLLPNTFAQADTEATIGILRGIFGDLPTACSDITNSTCIYCLGFVKLLPLAFFFGLFYLIFTYGIRLIVRNQSLGSLPSIHAGIVLISIALSVFTLQGGAVGGALSRISSFSEWIDSLILLIGMGVVAYFAFRIMNAINLTPGVGGRPNTILFVSIATLAFFLVFTGFVAVFAGVSNVFVFSLVLSLFFASMVLSFVFKGPLGLIFGILALLTLIGLFVLGIPLELTPSIFGESEGFDLGICA
jgi:hypothetical protein